MEAVLSNSSRKLIAVLKSKFIVLFITIFGMSSFPGSSGNKRRCVSFSRSRSSSRSRSRSASRSRSRSRDRSLSREKSAENRAAAARDQSRSRSASASNDDQQWWSVSVGPGRRTDTATFDDCQNFLADVTS